MKKTWWNTATVTYTERTSPNVEVLQHHTEHKPTLLTTQEPRRTKQDWHTRERNCRHQESPRKNQLHKTVCARDQPQDERDAHFGNHVNCFPEFSVISGPTTGKAHLTDKGERSSINCWPIDIRFGHRKPMDFSESGQCWRTDNTDGGSRINESGHERSSNLKTYQ